MQTVDDRSGIGAHHEAPAATGLAHVAARRRPQVPGEGIVDLVCLYSAVYHQKPGQGHAECLAIQQGSVGAAASGADPVPGIAAGSRSETSDSGEVVPCIYVSAVT